MIVASVMFDADGSWRCEVQATDGSDLLVDVVTQCVQLVREVNALPVAPEPGDGDDA